MYVEPVDDERRQREQCASSTRRRRPRSWMRRKLFAADAMECSSEGRSLASGDRAASAAGAPKYDRAAELLDPRPWPISRRPPPRRRASPSARHCRGSSPRRESSKAAGLDQNLDRHRRGVDRRIVAAWSGQLISFQSRPNRFTKPRFGSPPMQGHPGRLRTP